MLWKLTDKQREMSRAIEDHKYTLCIGQGRSGKSLLIVLKMFRNAIQYPNTNQAIFRNTLSSAIDGLWKVSVKEVIANFFPALPMMEGFKINESNHSITFPNGSRIVVKGLDNTERVQKLLSTQWMFVFFDEAHLIDYDHFGLLLTRLPQPLDVDYKVKIVCAANWCPKVHWLKTFFEDGKNPETKVKHNQKTQIITSVAHDNTTIDADDYIDTLNNAGDRRSRLACAGSGFYEEVEGALWVQDDIQHTEVLKLDDYDEVVLAFDPAITNTEKSDGHGVCISGRIGEVFHVIESYEKVEDVNVIAKEVAAKYHSYNCSKLVYEVNQGADWIKALIKNHDSAVYCEGVRAKKGKLLRAEPIAALYKNKLVYHTKNFRELEDQMLTYTGKGDSPNALDATVYALKYLRENQNYVNPDDI